MEWLLKSMCEQLGLPSGVKDRNATAMPIYIGDDVADEDAFAELNQANPNPNPNPHPHPNPNPNPYPNPKQGRGVPIVVRKTAPLRNETAADFYLRDPRQVSSCGCRTFYSCHPKQALAGVGQPGGRAGVVTPRGGSNPAPGPTLPACCSTRPRPCSSSPSSRASSGGSSRSRCCRVSCRAAAREQLSISHMPC